MTETDSLCADSILIFFRDVSLPVLDALWQRNRSLTTHQFEEQQKVVCELPNMVPLLLLQETHGVM